VSARLLIDAAEFWPAFEADARGARTRLFVQTLSFEADAAGEGLANLFLSLPATVDRRLVVDEFTRWVVNDRFLYAPAAIGDTALRREARESVRLTERLRAEGVQVHWTNPVGWRMHRLAARNHKKILVVDDRIAYIGGVNFSEHNFEWHDMMIRLDDPAFVACLANDFIETCEGRNQAVDRTFGEGRLIVHDGLSGPGALDEVFDMIRSAASEVFVESPYVSAPFLDPLRDAAARGVRVVVLVPEAVNWGWYNAYIRVECFRRGLDLCILPGGMNHLKAILIDGKTLVVGSANFDNFSYYINQELLFVTTHEPLVRDFRERVYAPEMAIAQAVPLSGEFSWRTRWDAIRVEAGYPTLRWMNTNI
jgi:cardiolipin synthase A/B